MSHPNPKKASAVKVSAKAASNQPHSGLAMITQAAKDALEAKAASAFHQAAFSVPVVPSISGSGSGSMKNSAAAPFKPPAVTTPVAMDTASAAATLASLASSSAGTSTTNSPTWSTSSAIATATAPAAASAAVPVSWMQKELESDAFKTRMLNDASRVVVTYPPPLVEKYHNFVPDGCRALEFLTGTLVKFSPSTRVPHAISDLQFRDFGVIYSVSGTFRLYSSEGLIASPLAYNTLACHLDGSTENRLIFEDKKFAMEPDWVHIIPCRYYSKRKLTHVQGFLCTRTVEELSLKWTFLKEKPVTIHASGDDSNCDHLPEVIKATYHPWSQCKNGSVMRSVQYIRGWLVMSRVSDIGVNLIFRDRHSYYNVHAPSMKFRRITESFSGCEDLRFSDVSGFRVGNGVVAVLLRAQKVFFSSVEGHMIIGLAAIKSFRENGDPYTRLFAAGIVLPHTMTVRCGRLKYD